MGPNEVCIICVCEKNSRETDGALHKITNRSISNQKGSTPGSPIGSLHFILKKILSCPLRMKNFVFVRLKHGHFFQITNQVCCPYLKTSLPWSGPRAIHDGQILHSSTHNTVPVSNILKIIDTKRPKKTAQSRRKF